VSAQPPRRARRFTAALGLGLAVALFASGPGAADPGHGPGATLELQPVSIALDLADPSQVPIDWALHNGAGHAITIHGASSPRAESVTLMRQRSLLGLTSYQPVDFLRLEGGETVRLASPEYVLKIDGLAESGATIFPITLDLGPDGVLSLALVEPLGE
jgi:hypothetical protein